MTSNGIFAPFSNFTRNYTLDYLGTLIPHCTIQTNDFNCLKCVDGKAPKLVADQSLATHPHFVHECVDTLISDCSLLDENDVCVECFGEEFLNIEGECIENPENCQDFDENGICVECLTTGFELVNNLCQQIDNCQESESNTCTKCNSGYVLINGFSDTAQGFEELAKCLPI